MSSVRRNTLSWLPRIGATLIICLLGTLPISIRAQKQNDKWQRVYTGDDSIIEINGSSLRFEPNHILRVGFRTTFSKPENLVGSPGAKYKSRLETIDFKLDEQRYRLYETTLLDPQGRTLQSYAATSLEDWRVLKQGGIMERLFNAALALPPFGLWKAVAYRFADGNPTGVTPTPELARLVGTRVRLQSDRVAVGATVCTAPAFEDRRASKEEFSRSFGIQFESIGIKAEQVEAINVRCEGSEWAPPQSLLVKVSEGEMLMLWDGVFLVLKRERHWTGDVLPPLKRRVYE